MTDMDGNYSDNDDYQPSPDAAHVDAGDGEPTNSFESTEKKQRKSCAGRKLVRWSPEMDQLVLLCVDYVCVKNNVAIPWDKVGEAMEREFLTAEAIKQHLVKMRRAREVNGQQVPPKAGAHLRRKVNGSVAGTPVKSRSKTAGNTGGDEYDEATQKSMRSLIHTPSEEGTPSSKGKKAGVSRQKTTKDGEQSMVTAKKEEPVKSQPINIKIEQNDDNDGDMRSPSLEQSKTAKSGSKRARPTKNGSKKDELEIQFGSPSKKARVTAKRQSKPKTKPSFPTELVSTAKPKRNVSARDYTEPVGDGDDPFTDKPSDDDDDDDDDDSYDEEIPRARDLTPPSDEQRIPSTTGADWSATALSTFEDVMQTYNPPGAMTIGSAQDYHNYPLSGSQSYAWGPASEVGRYVGIYANQALVNSSSSTRDTIRGFDSSDPINDQHSDQHSMALATLSNGLAHMPVHNILSDSTCSSNNLQLTPASTNNHGIFQKDKSLFAHPTPSEAAGEITIANATNRGQNALDVNTLGLPFTMNSQNLQNLGGLPLPGLAHPPISYSGSTMFDMLGDESTLNFSNTTQGSMGLTSLELDGAGNDVPYQQIHDSFDSGYNDSVGNGRQDMPDSSRVAFPFGQSQESYFDPGAYEQDFPGADHFNSAYLEVNDR